MSRVGLAFVVVYLALLAVGLRKTRLLRGLVIRPFGEALPMLLAAFWRVYPGRFWPGPLKLVGYPMTFVFLASVIVVFTAFHILVVVMLSPKIIWWLFQPRSPAAGRPV